MRFNRRSGAFPGARMGAPASVVVVLCALFLVSPGPVHAAPIELIANGDFESGAGGWSVATSSSSASWFLDDVGSSTPLQGLPTSSLGGGSGTYAVADQAVVAVSALLQSFGVPTPAVSVVLSFDMFVNDWSSSTTFDPDQFARVDLLTENASPGDLGAGVLFNAYLGSDGGPLPNEFVHYEFNITPFVAAGGDFQIRFFQADSFSVLNMGVDNVSVQFVPEPSTLVPLAVGILLIGSRRRRAPGTIDP